MGIFNTKVLKTRRAKAMAPKEHTILLVDDEELNLDILSDLLRDKYNVLTANSALVALDLIRNYENLEQLHLIISDQRMPEMTGVEFLEKSLEMIPKAMRIILTGYSDSDMIIRAINKARIYQFLLKPIENQNLLVTVERAMEAFTLREKNDALIEALRSLNATLEQKVEERTSELRGKNQQILSSIEYARHIQESILPDPGNIRTVFPNSFTLAMPRDLVSGDFLWYAEDRDGVFLAAVDCTGHGVPGAFLSIMAHTLLKQTVHTEGIVSPAIILERLHLGVREALKQDRGNTYQANAGMEMALCRIEPRRKRIVFAGAGRPLYLVHCPEGKEARIEEIKGNRKSIGGHQKEAKRTFTDHEIVFDGGGSLYLTTDGYADQPNMERTKFGSPRLKAFLRSIARLPMDQQKQALVEELTSFQGQMKQRDDITLIGVGF